MLLFESHIIDQRNQYQQNDHPEKEAKEELAIKMKRSLRKMVLEDGLTPDPNSQTKFWLLRNYPRAEIRRILVEMKNNIGDFFKGINFMQQEVDEYSFTGYRVEIGNTDVPIMIITSDLGKEPVDGLGNDGKVKYWSSSTYLSPSSLQRFSKLLLELKKTKNENSELFIMQLEEMHAIVTDFKTAS